MEYRMEENTLETASVEARDRSNASIGRPRRLAGGIAAMLGVWSGLTLTLPAMPAGADQKVRVVLRNLYCEKTTETGIFGGHDEVYVMVSGVTSSGSTFSDVKPGTDGDADGGKRWDCNDSGSKQDRWLRYPLSSLTVNRGETAYLRLTFMESDGTNLGKILEAAAGLASKMSSNPYVVAGSGLGGILAQWIPANEDDYLGGVLLEFKNSGQGIERKIMPSEGVDVLGEWDDSGANGLGSGFSLRLHGDSRGRYLVHVNSVGDMREPEPEPQPSPWIGENRFFPMDINGDHETDLLARHPDGTMDVWLSDGQRLSFSHAFPTNFKDEWGWGSGLRYFLMDINGDGKTDLVTRQDDGLLYFHLSDGYQLVPSGTQQTGFRADWGWGEGNRYLVMDLNGDRKSDLIARQSDGLFYILLSDGSKLVPSGTQQTGFSDAWDDWQGPNRFFVMDINGDGKSDLVGRLFDGRLLINLSDGSKLVSSGVQQTIFSDTLGR
jgi:hypothetical protein